MSGSLQELSWRRDSISRSMLFPVELKHRHRETLAPWKATHGCRFHANTYSSERNPTGGLAATSIMSGVIASCWLYCCCWNWFLNGMVETQLVIITEYQDNIFADLHHVTLNGCISNPVTDLWNHEHNSRGSLLDCVFQINERPNNSHCNVFERSNYGWWLINAINGSIVFSLN